MREARFRSFQTLRGRSTVTYNLGATPDIVPETTVYRVRSSDTWSWPSSSTEVYGPSYASTAPRKKEPGA